MKPSSAVYLFVYGTLAGSEKIPESIWLQHHSGNLGTAYVKGKLFHAGEYPAAIPDESQNIEGVLLELKPGNESTAWELLDAYEAYDPDDEPGSLFVRKQTEVMFGNEIITAWIYWYHRDTSDFPPLPNGKWCI